MSLLSDRQRDELYACRENALIARRITAVLDWLHAQGLQRTVQALKTETDRQNYAHDGDSRQAGLLEKKWTSVIRLQKKIMDLETRNAQLLEELSTARVAPVASKSSADWLPRLPARHTLTGHRSPITRVAFHPQFTALVTASEDASLKIWDWETGEFERTLKGHTKAVQDCDFDSKGNSLDLTIKLWDVINEYKNTKTLFGHDHSVSSVRFLPSDDFIVSASRDKTIRIWEVASGFCVRTLSGHAEWVRAVTPSSDGRLLASCSNDWTARLWDATSGESRTELRGHEHVVEAVVFAPEAAHAAIRELAGLTSTRSFFIATASRDKTVRIWDGLSGQCLRTLNGHDNWVRALVFHPSGNYLLSASDDKTIRVWDLKTGRCTKTIEAHDHFVTCLAWGKVLASGSVDQSVRVWAP